jgi:hypothetical protein
VPLQLANEPDRSETEPSLGVADRSGHGGLAAVDGGLPVAAETLEVGEHLGRDGRAGQLDVTEIRRGVLDPILPRERADDLGADLLGIGVERPQYAHGNPVVRPDEPEQDVLGADVVVSEGDRFLECQLERPLAPRRERDLAGGRDLATGLYPQDLGADLVERDIQRVEDARCDALLLAEQAEQEVLRPDVVVTEAAGLLLREDDSLARALSEALEHASSVTNGARCPT